MGCLCCQKQFEDHSGKELIECITWIQDKLHLRSEQNRFFYEKIKEIYQNFEENQ